MKTILFSKMFPSLNIAQLVQLAHDWDFDGYDLCVRPGFPVTPDNAADTLPEAARIMRGEGLDIPMVTGNFDLLTPDHPTAQPLLQAMDKADIRLLKLGYFRFDPLTFDYQKAMADARRDLESWLPLARQYNVKICYHTHSGKHLGHNAAAVASLLENCDPKYFGAYIDPGHQLVDGEAIELALAAIRPWLAIVALKDVLLQNNPVNGHGHIDVVWPPAGSGMVDWTEIFQQLRRVAFNGPLSVHCQFLTKNMPDYFELARQEVAFFKRFTTL